MDGVSLSLTGFNQSLLFSRALHYLGKQTLDKEKWELIVIDDCSAEDWESLLEPYRESINIRYIRLGHSRGWRSCERGYNVAFKESKFDILAVTNPHLILHPEALEFLYLVHHTDQAKELNGRLWASLRGYTVTREDMPHFEEVDWRSSLENVKKLPRFQNPWTLLWTDRKKFYGSFLCCSFRKDRWFEDIAVTEYRGAINKEPGFPETFSYGNIDPWFLGTRRRAGWVDINFDIERVYFIHQDHYTHAELAKRFNVRSLLDEDGQSQLTAAWWGREWKPLNPEGTWPAPPVPWESYIPGSKKLPKLREEYLHYYDRAWAKEHAPWLLEELE